MKCRLRLLSARVQLISVLLFFAFWPTTESLSQQTPDPAEPVEIPDFSDPDVDAAEIERLTPSLRAIPGPYIKAWEICRANWEDIEGWVGDLNLFEYHITLETVQNPLAEPGESGIEEAYLLGLTPRYRRDDSTDPEIQRKIAAGELFPYVHYSGRIAACYVYKGTFEYIGWIIRKR